MQLVPKINEIINFTDDQKKSFIELMKVLQKVINSPEFKEKVLNFSYTYTTGRWFWKKTYTEKGFADTGDSPEKIFSKFMSGATVLQPENDNELDIYITLYFSSSRTIGYTTPDTLKTWINGKFFAAWLQNKTGRASIIGNIVHEYMHKVGYDHSGGATQQFTVPYAYGNIAEKVAQEVFYSEL